MERRKVSKGKNGGAFRRFVFGEHTPHEVYRFLINILYPNICPCCEEIIDYNDDFCDSCRNKLIPYNGNFQIKHTDLFVACCIYEGRVRYAIRKFKYEDRGNSYYAFAFNIVQALYRAHVASDIDEVVYIPMTKESLEKRGYNQTKLIAKEIHYILEIPCTNALIKVKDTKSQKSLGGKERKENISDAFALNERVSVRGKCILLIDDLCTTGSTLSEAARVLKEGGAEKVIAAAFAKTKSADSSIST